MQRFQRSLIRIVKGPTGGFLASLGIAAVLGGVALATPSPPIAAVGAHHPDVIVAAPLGSDLTSTGAVASEIPRPSGGVRTDADPTGRGPAFETTQNGHGSASLHHGNGGSSGGGASSRRIRSAGVEPAHQDARDDRPAPGGPTHHHPGSGHHPPGSGSGSSEGEHGSGSGTGSSGHGGSGDSSSGNGGGSGSGRPGGSGSGGSTSGLGDHGDGGGSGSSGSGGPGGSGFGSSGSGSSSGNHTNGRLTH